MNNVQVQDLPLFINNGKARCILFLCTQNVDFLAPERKEVHLSLQRKPLRTFKKVFKIK
jgi:hypothetical protein